jgi:hypothetical protein
LDGVIAATKEIAKDVKEISVGERSGITVPTRFNFNQAGYPEVISILVLNLLFLMARNFLPSL